MRYMILLLLLTGCYYMDGQFFLTNETYQDYNDCMNQSLQLPYSDLFEQYNVCLESKGVTSRDCNSGQYYACKRYIKESTACFDEEKWRDMYITACMSSQN